MMAKRKKKVDSKTLTQQKRHRRQWVTFMRMCRYGVNNFTRNAWLSLAATAVMTITLFVIFTSVGARQVLVDTVASLSDSVNMSIYVKTDVSDQAVEQIRTDLDNLNSVLEVAYVSPEQAREDYIQENRHDPTTLEAVKEASNRFPGTFNIKVKDINDTSELASFVETNQTVKDNLDPNTKPSFAGDRRETIQNIANAAQFALQVGVIASIVFIAMSMLIIFNTIRMAIFNRREEIQMMKLIGAERSFIRGPFVVEAIVYGFFAAILATGMGYALIYLVAPPLRQFGIAIQPTIDASTYYVGFVLLGMIIIGAIIGVVSSLLATRRYLKI